jgi:hypothetical protein
MTTRLSTPERCAGTGESVSRVLAELEYPARYDRVLGVVCLVGSGTTLAVTPLFEAGGRFTLDLVATAPTAFVSARGRSARRR